MLNKITLGISICFLISGIILNLFHIAQLNNLYKEERALTQRIVGGILNNYPEAVKFYLNLVIKKAPFSRMKVLVNMLMIPLKYLP